MRSIGFVVVGLFAFVAIPAAATTHTVTVQGRSYTPGTLEIQAGDSVTFTNLDGFHNVLSAAGAVTAFRCANGCDGDGAGGDGTPAQAGWSATVTFPTPGAAPYYCEVHGTSMAGLITVLESPIFRDGFDG